MHWHRHDYISVMLGAAEISNTVKEKPPVILKVVDGEARFSSAAFAHVARNLGTKLFRNVAIEILEDEKLRGSSAHWDEERGLEVLANATRQILFVKDGIRVSEFDLQPGAVVPAQHRTSAQLRVAITDLDIRDGIKGESAVPAHLKSGETKWLPGGQSFTVTNTGNQIARFITLEFP